MIETTQVMRAALKVVLPLLAIGAAVVAARRRSPNPRETLALTAPDPSATAAWIIVFVALFVGSDVVMHWRGPWDWTPWRDAPLFVSICRVLGVCILGPIAEELIFRAVLYERLLRAGLDSRLVVVILAAAWAVLHYSYSGGVISLIFVGGLFLGAARRQTGSVVPSILMHIAWNLYAIW